jgi:hypothetical protein
MGSCPSGGGIPPYSTPPPVESLLVSLMDTQYFLGTSSLVGGGLPIQSLEEQWSFPVLEEVAPMVVEKIILLPLAWTQLLLKPSLHHTK